VGGAGRNRSKLFRLGGGSNSDEPAPAAAGLAKPEAGRSIDAGTEGARAILGGGRTEGIRELCGGGRDDTPMLRLECCKPEAGAGAADRFAVSTWARCTKSSTRSSPKMTVAVSSFHLRDEASLEGALAIVPDPNEPRATRVAKTCPIYSAIH
jgi:hypothetical protein